MQKINYQDTIVLNNPIKELLLINIDEQLNQIKEINNIKITGAINISGEVITDIGKENFMHGLDVDILLDKDQLIQEHVIVNVDDFEYELSNNEIKINLIIKIDGLKELEPYFPAQEDQGYFEIENSDPIFLEEVQDININEIQENINIPLEIIPEVIEHQPPEQNIRSNSLLRQIFKSKQLNTSTNYLFHVVKEKCTYKDIAEIYNCNEEVLKNLNNNQDIYIGKLIHIPK